MAITDPVSDMLSRIRNALSARKRYVLVPSSKLKRALAQILVDEGYVKNLDVVDQNSQEMLRLWLKYTDDTEPMITGLERISKPGRRIYAAKDEIPWVLSGIGVAVISTSRGVMTDRQARRRGVGGEVVCFVW